MFFFPKQQKYNIISYMINENYFYESFRHK